MDKILYNLVKIDTKLFEINLDNYDEGSSPDKTVTVSFKVNSKFCNLSVLSEIQYKQENRDVLKLQVECVFNIESNSFKGLTENGKISIPAALARSLFATTTSTARGVLFDKLEDTILKNEILPIPDWTEIKDLEQSI